MSLRATLRSVDDLIIFAMAERKRGVRLAFVAKRMNLPASYLSAAIQRVKAADIKECAFWGDNPASVKRAYE